MKKEVLRCKSCILPSSSLIHLDITGTCNLCSQVQHSAPVRAESDDRAEKLEKLVANIKERGRGRPYDCVVGVSGGRDSTYLLYLLTRKHNLRCIAGYYRTPFTSDVTDTNARRLAASLNVHLVDLPISREFHKRVAGEMTNLWAKRPHPVIINMACGPCKLLNRELYKLAKRIRARTLVCGDNRFESVQVAASISQGASLTSSSMAAEALTLWPQIRTSAMLIRKGIGVLGMSAKMWRYLPLGIESSLMYVSPHTPYLRIRYPDIQALEYFYYAEWSEQECKEALSAVGWELPPGCKSEWKSDCSFAELKNLVLPQNVWVAEGAKS